MPQWSPGQSLQDAPAVLQLSAGVYAGGVVLQGGHWSGEPGATLEGGSPVLRMDVDDGMLQLQGLCLQGGRGESAGGLVLCGFSLLELSDCLLVANSARTGGAAGGAYVSRGTLLATDCRWEGNSGGIASDLVVTGVGVVTLRRCLLMGDVALREGAQLSLEDCVVEGVLSARGTTTRAPSLRLVRTIVRGGVRNHPDLPASVEVC